MVDEKTNKVRIVDDETEAAEAALRGGTPRPFSGKMTCPGCENGKALGLKVPPSDPSYKVFQHLKSHHEHNTWNIRRLPEGRMTRDDVLGFQVPHPHEMIHHGEDGNSRVGGFFNTQGHLAHRKGHPTPNIGMGQAKQLINYLENEAPMAGAFNNPELNKILGLGHPQTGMNSVQNITTGEWTHQPVEFGKMRAGDDLHWHNIGMKKIMRMGNNNVAKEVNMPDPDHPYPGLGPWLQWQHTQGPVALHNEAEERLNKFNQHDHLRSVGEKVRVGKTPCGYCAGHGTVQGFRVMAYLGAFPDWHTITTVPVKTGQTWSAGVDRPETEGITWGAELNTQHEEHDQHHDEVNQYLSVHSAPFGRQWATNDPFTELQEDQSNTYLCPECSGLGICTPCGGDGEIPVVDPSMSEEEAQEFNESWPRWKKATNIAFSAPGQPFMQPGVSASGEPLPSFFQTEPGPGQFKLRTDYTDAPPYIAPPSGLSRGIVPVVRPQRGHMTARQKEKAAEREEKRREARAKRGRVGVGNENWLDDLRQKLRQPSLGMPPVKLVQSPLPQPVAPPLQAQEAIFDEGGRMTGVIGSSGVPASLQRDDDDDDDEVGENELYHAHDESDHRNFKLIDNKTPFEHHGNQAWDEWDDRKFIPNQFKQPKETNSYGQGIGFRIDDKGRGFIDDTVANEKWKEAHADSKSEWESRRASGLVLPPDTPTQDDDIASINQKKQKDLNASRKKIMQQMTSRIYRSPNTIWRDRSFRDLQAALKHGGLEGTRVTGSKLDNSHLLREFEKRGGGDGAKGKIDDEEHVMNSPLAEMALFRMIRAVHPDWLPSAHDDLRMPHDDYISMATAKQKQLDEAVDSLNLSEGALMRDALAILKFYDEHAPARKRVGVVDTVASVSSLNHAASAHPSKIGVKR